MKPRRTHLSNRVFRLAGGNEDNDLWVHRTLAAADGDVLLVSIWEPTAAERQAIADGQNIELVIWGERQPPVCVGVTDVPLGRAPEAVSNAG